jgi:ribosome recycling factor
MNNGENIIINSALTEETKKKRFSKTSQSEAEAAKIGIRNAQKDANNDIKKRRKDGLAKILLSQLKMKFKN